MVGWLSMGRSGSALEVGRRFAPVRRRHLFDLGMRHCVAAAMAPMAGEAEWFTDHCGQPPGSVHVNFSLRRAALASRGAVPWRLAFVALGMRSWLASTVGCGRVSPHIPFWRFGRMGKH
jgi:hypothetical protein